MAARAYRRALDLGAVTAAVLLGVIALLVTVDVAARNLGLGTLPWIIDVTEYSLPLATFLIAPWLLDRGEHVRLDLLVTAVPPRVARLLERTADALGLLICAVFVAYGAQAIASSARQGSMVIKALVFPEWWLYVPVPVCFAFLAVGFARRLAGARSAPGR